MNNKKLKAKFKYADRLKIPYLAIVGEDEIKNNTVSIKNLKTGEQRELNYEDAIELLKMKD